MNRNEIEKTLQKTYCYWSNSQRAIFGRSVCIEKIKKLCYNTTEKINKMRVYKEF